MSHRSIHQLFAEVAAANRDKAAYRHKKDGDWVDVTWGEMQSYVAGVSKALMTLGVGKGQRISVLSGTRLEWVACDFGAVSCGAVTVGIYHSSLAPECAYVVRHSDSEILFVEDAEQLHKILAVRADLPALRQIVIFDGPSDPTNDVLSWAEFLGKGVGVADDRMRERMAAVEAEDLASLVYTSGTTGVQKGVMITHRNLLFASESSSRCLELRPHQTTLIFLPLAHVFARLTIYFCMRTAVTVAFAEDISRVPENLKEIRPHFIPSVPRIYEKVYDKVLSGVEAAGGVKQKLFNWALGVGLKVSRLKQAKQPVPMGLRLQYGVADNLVFRKIREALGGRLEFAVSGAAPLNRKIAEFFHACGVLILEGIGMTENTSFSNVNRLDDNKFGTVGQVGPGIEMKIAEDGEVLFRGPNVMKGYFKDPEATADTIDGDGWLYSGDIGEIDEDGFLKITDRKKDLIVTAGGKNVAPQRVERVLRTSHYIGQALACGDKRKFISALVTLDPDSAADWARQHELGPTPLEALAENPELEALIRSEIDERNRELASYEQVKKFRILPGDFTIEGGELTPTLKIKRKVVVEKYSELIDAMYAAS